MVTQPKPQDCPNCDRGIVDGTDGICSVCRAVQEMQFRLEFVYTPAQVNQAAPTT